MAQEEDGRLKFEAIINDKAFMKKLDDINKGIKGMGDESEKTNKKVEQSNKKAASSFGLFNKALIGIGSTLKTLAGSFGIFAGIGAIVGLFSSAVRDVVQFDKSMVNLSAIAGKTRSELKGLEQDIRNIAAESINTAPQVANMAMELIKLGTTPEGVSDLLKPVNDLSIAFQASADSVAVLLKGTLNAFNEGEAQAQKFADVMAMAANQTALGFTEIADAFTYIASSASAMGYSIEETSAMMGVLVDNNVQASSAGRILSSTFGRLAKQGLTLESQLEKVANATDKMGVSAQIFGAEGARLGLILANNQDKLKGLTTEFENAEGSLAKLTGAQLESLSARTAILTSAWTELILKMEDGNGVLANFIKDGIDGITWWIEAIGSFMVSADDMRKKMIEQASQNIYSSVEQTVLNMDPKTQEEALKASMQYANAMAKQLEMDVKAQQQKVEELQDSFLTKMASKGDGFFGALFGLKGASRQRVESLKDEEAILEKLNQEYAAYKEITKTGVDVNITETNETTSVVELTKEQLALLDKIAKVERELTYGFLDTREAGLAKIVDKYKELVKEAEKLNMSTSKLNQLQQTEQDLFNYKLDTDELEKSLQEQKALYADFEQYKKNTTNDFAKDAYKGQIDVAKEYIDLVQDEMEKIDLSSMTAKESHRYRMLEGLVMDYYKEKTNIERDQLEQLFVMTQTTEEKINAVRLKYAKLNAELSNQFTGVELENRQNELAKQAQNEFDTLSNSILDSANKYADVTDLVAGATRNQIESQIASLTNFIKTTSTLTEDQVNAIQSMIDKLRLALPSAEGQSGFGATMAIQNEYKSIENTINQLLDRIKTLNKEFGDGASESAQEIAILNAQIAGLRSRMNDLRFDSIIASGKDLESLGNSFLEMANNADFAGSAVSGLLGALGGIVSVSGNVLGALGGIGKGLSDISGAGGLGGVFKSGKESGGLLGGLGSVAGALGPIAAGASSIFGIVDGIGKKQREEYRLFKQWQDEVIRGEREYQALLRERSFQSVSTNQPDKTMLEQQMQVAKQNQAEASKQYLDQLESLQKQGHQIIDRYRSKGLFGSKTKTKWGDLIGVDFDELEKLSMMGKLDEQSQAWFEELVKVKQELEDIGLTIEDLERQYAELMTGTDWRAMSQTFADMFANATNSAENFAITVEDLIKNAIVAGFKAKYIDKEMQELFDKLAEASEDGELTQEEIDKLTQDALDRLAKLQEQWERLTGNLGLDFGTDSQDTTGKDTVKRITEVQADRMTGAILGMQVSIIENTKMMENHLNILSLSNRILNDSYSMLVAIERNTYNINQGVGDLRQDVQQLQVIMKDNQNRVLGL